MSRFFIFFLGVVIEACRLALSCRLSFSRTFWGARIKPICIVSKEFKAMNSIFRITFLGRAKPFEPRRRALQKLKSK
jgi:hypothetical protein